MEKVKKKEPMLRFPHFTNEWIENKLELITSKIGDGLHGTPSYVEDSGYYFINGNNLFDGKINLNGTSKQVSFIDYKKNNKGITFNSILISINGTIGTIARYNGENIMLGKSVGYLIFESDCSFFYYCLQTDKVQNHFISELTGTTIKNLSLKTLRETKVIYPTDNEQQKISSFCLNPR